VSDSTDYRTMVEALALHAISLKKYGGGSGLRDVGALEVALFRPQTGYYADIIEQAAALLESLAVNHPFIDDNKRVAFAVTDTFLRINGYVIQSDSATIFKKMIELFESNYFEFSYLEPWLRSISHKK
jgi:death on curing protein